VTEKRGRSIDAPLLSGRRPTAKIIGVALSEFRERGRPNAEHRVRAQVHPRGRPLETLGCLFVQRIGEAD
jgi:hypothetical protein